MNNIFLFAYGILNYAGEWSLYCLDVKVFGGKLVKNSFTCCWVPSQDFRLFSCPFIYTLSIIGTAVSEVSKVCPISPYQWNLIFFVGRHVIKSLQRRNVAKYFQQRSWFGEKFVPQTAYLSSEVNKYTAELSFGSSRNTLSRRAH